jgi:hypothetical protein
VLAVLECRASDDAVRAQAVAAASAAGGWLTLVAVPPPPFPCFGGGYYTPRASTEELRAEAEAALARAVALIPADVPLITAVDDGNAGDVIRRRVEVAAHDVVFARRRRLRRWLRPLPAPVLAVAG